MTNILVFFVSTTNKDLVYYIINFKFYISDVRSVYYIN